MGSLIIITWKPGSFNLVSQQGDSLAVGAQASWAGWGKVS